MISRSISRWALRALALWAIKTVVQMANDRASRPKSAKPSGGRLRAATGVRARTR